MFDELVDLVNRLGIDKVGKRQATIIRWSIDNDKRSAFTVATTLREPSIGGRLDGIKLTVRERCGRERVCDARNVDMTVEDGAVMVSKKTAVDHMCKILALVGQYLLLLL